MLTPWIRRITESPGMTSSSTWLDFEEIALAWWIESNPGYDGFRWGRVPPMWHVQSGYAGSMRMIGRQTTLLEYGFDGVAKCNDDGSFVYLQFKTASIESPGVVYAQRFATFMNALGVLKSEGRSVRSCVITNAPVQQSAMKGMAISYGTTFHVLDRATCFEVAERLRGRVYIHVGGCREGRMIVPVGGGMGEMGIGLGRFLLQQAVSVEGWDRVAVVSKNAERLLLIKRALEEEHVRSFHLYRRDDIRFHLGDDVSRVPASANVLVFVDRTMGVPCSSRDVVPWMMDGTSRLDFIAAVAREDRGVVQRIYARHVDRLGFHVDEDDHETDEDVRLLEQMCTESVRKEVLDAVSQMCYAEEAVCLVRSSGGGDVDKMRFHDGGFVSTWLESMRSGSATPQTVAYLEEFLR